MKPRLLFIAGLIIAACGGTGCSKSSTASSANTDAAHKHVHKPPHGGTAIVLGNEAYHVELVRDAAAGKLTLYVMDGELENFVRVAAPEIDVSVTVADKPTTLTFEAIPNAVTGEKVGDTSQFEAIAEWLKTTDTFDAFLVKIEIRGSVFTSVMFSFPQGNDKD